MAALAGLQRIKSAHITVNGHLIASSNQGILALIGIEEVDTEDDADSMAKRILQTMLWPEANETQVSGICITAKHGRRLTRAASGGVEAECSRNQRRDTV